MVDASGDGARQAGGGGVANCESVEDWVLQWQSASCGGEYQVAVHRSVAGHNGARHAVVGGDGHALRLSLRKVGIGGDDGDGGVVAAEFGLEVRRVMLRGRAEAAEFTVELKWGGPEMRRVADGDRP